MKDIVAILDANFAYLDHKIIGDHIIIYVESRRDEATCPTCGKVSNRVHSTYERSFQDLPIQGRKVFITITNRKYFCDNKDCPNTTFAESFECLKPKAKKSERLKDKIMKISVEVSSLTASKMLKDGIADVSKSTICDMLKKNNRSVGQGKRRENLHR